MAVATNERKPCKSKWLIPPNEETKEIEKLFYIRNNNMLFAPLLSVIHVEVTQHANSINRVEFASRCTHESLSCRQPNSQRNFVTEMDDIGCTSPRLGNRFPLWLVRTTQSDSTHTSTTAHSCVKLNNVWLLWVCVSLNWMRKTLRTNLGSWAYAVAVIFSFKILIIDMHIHSVLLFTKAMNLTA